MKKRHILYIAVSSMVISLAVIALLPAAKETYIPTIPYHGSATIKRSGGNNYLSASGELQASREGSAATGTIIVSFEEKKTEEQNTLECSWQLRQEQSQRGYKTQECFFHHPVIDQRLQHIEQSLTTAQWRSIPLELYTSIIQQTQQQSYHYESFSQGKTKKIVFSQQNSLDTKDRLSIYGRSQSTGERAGNISISPPSGDAFRHHSKLSFERSIE